MINIAVEKKTLIQHDGDIKAPYYSRPHFTTVKHNYVVWADSFKAATLLGWLERRGWWLQYGLVNTT